VTGGHRLKGGQLLILGMTAIVLAGALACSTGNGSPAAERDRVRAVVMPYLTFMPFHIAQEEGYFAEQNLDVEFVRLERIQELMTGLALGEVDVAAGMLTVNVMNSVAKGARIRLVGALGHLDRDGCSFNAIVARRALVDSGALTDPKRLRALTFDADVLLPYGYWLDEAVRPAGLTIDDLTIVNLPESAAGEALLSGAVDVTLVSEPFLGQLLTSSEAAIWKRTNELFPDYQISVMMYGPELLDERPEVGDRFAAAMLKAIRQYKQGRTPRNLEIVERASGLSVLQLQSACWPASRADGHIDLDAFHGYQAWAVSRGYAERVLDADELVERRFIDYANRELAR
jgi:NitT/TauT family transport system substrate-binding protein